MSSCEVTSGVTPHHSRRVIAVVASTGFLLGHGFALAKVDDAFFESDYAQSDLWYTITMGVTSGLRMLVPAMAMCWLIWRPRNGSSARLSAVLLLALTIGVLLDSMASDATWNLTLSWAFVSWSVIAMGALLVLAFGPIRAFTFVEANERSVDKGPHRIQWSLRGILASVALCAMFVSSLQWQVRLYRDMNALISDFEGVYAFGFSIATAVSMLGCGFAWTRKRISLSPVLLFLAFVLSAVTISLGEFVAHESAEWTANAISAAILLGPLWGSWIIWHWLGFRLQ